MKIFLDTSAFMALILKDESYHQKMADQYKAYKKSRAQLITSDYILDELYTRCVYRAGSFGAKLAIDLIQDIVSHNELTVLGVDSHIFKKAQEIFLKFSDNKISFTDATSYVLYKDFALDEIFTLDSDFKKMRISTSF
ncbi:MAG: PIN domain-containing protein [Candidatus Daviesbacteria bacterium]|nr:PIN domain-containing protein [Candidatus Daviesbacteria bacterium]